MDSLFIIYVHHIIFQTILFYYHFISLSNLRFHFHVFSSNKYSEFSTSIFPFWLCNCTSECKRSLLTSDCALKCDHTHSNTFITNGNDLNKKNDPTHTNFQKFLQMRTQNKHIYIFSAKILEKKCHHPHL